MLKLAVNNELARTFMNFVEGLPPVYDTRTGQMYLGELSVIQKAELRFLKDDHRVKNDGEIIVIASKGEEQWFECRPKAYLAQCRASQKKVKAAECAVQS